MITGGSATLGSLRKEGRKESGEVEQLLNMGGPSGQNTNESCKNAD